MSSPTHCLSTLPPQTPTITGSLNNNPTDNRLVAPEDRFTYFRGMIEMLYAKVERKQTNFFKVRRAAKQSRAHADSQAWPPPSIHAWT